VLEDQFVRLLETLQPKSEYLCLFRAVVLDYWKAEIQGAADVAARLEQRATELKQQLRQVEDAFVLERRIDHLSYADLRDRLREQLALVELERSDARLQEIDIEGLLHSRNTSWDASLRFGPPLPMTTALRCRTPFSPGGYGGEHLDLEPR
jgi:hypothetical protein